MGYDIVDAYEDINALNNKLNLVIKELAEKGVLKVEEKKE